MDLPWSKYYSRLTTTWRARQLRRSPILYSGLINECRVWPPVWNGQVSADAHSPLALLVNFNHFFSSCHVAHHQAIWTYHPFIFISLHSKNMKSLEASQVVTLPVPDSSNGPMQSLTKERLRAVGVTQDAFRRRTAGTVENELMENVSTPASLGSKSLNTSGRQSRHVGTALSHAVPKRAELVNASRPMNKLPPELLFQVFDFVGSGPAILPLAQVCRRWRAVALSSP